MEIKLQTWTSCPSVIKLSLIMSVFLNGPGYHSVGAATCNKNTCEATDFTLSTCNTTTQICDCKTGYVPIPTGCGPKLEKPIITIEEGRTKEFLPGATVKLTCSTSDAGIISFVWTKDGKEVRNHQNPLYEISKTDADKIGNFSCHVEDKSALLKSEESDIVQIKLANTSAVTPAVDAASLPLYAAPGAVLGVKCKDIPYGATYKFSINSAAPTNNVTQNSSNTEIVCVLDDIPGGSYANNRSAPQHWRTTDADDIRQVTISPSTGTVLRTGDELSLFCATVPEGKYMVVGSNKVRYTFEDSVANVTGIVVNSYLLKSTVPSIHEMVCSATYTRTNTTLKSGPVNITFSDDYIKTPVLNASETQIKEGSRLVLQCGVAQDKSVTYSWVKDGARISRQYDRIIQFGTAKASDAGKFYCTASKDNYKVQSNELVISSTAYSLHVLSSTLLLLVAVVCLQNA